MMGVLRNLFILCIVCYTTAQVDYCSTPTCGTSQIACNNNGSFYPACVQPNIIPMNQTYIDLILNAHNKYRNLIAGGGNPNLPTAKRMSRMTWSNSLANMSRFYVNQCNTQLTDCHDTPTFKKSGQNGESIVSTATFTPTSVINKAIDQWYAASNVTTANDINNLTYPSESGENIYSFTLMVNDHNVAVGCAFLQYKTTVKGKQYNAYLFICDYSTVNFIDIPVYVSGATASGCTTHDSTYTALCGANENIDCNYYWDNGV